MIWDDSPELLDRAEKKLREYLTVSDFKFYIPSYEHLANIYLASVPGQEKGLDSGFLFLTPLSLALCLFINYTTFTPDEEGVYFVSIRPRACFSPSYNKVKSRRSMSGF